MHTEPSSTRRTRITVKNVPAERATRYSDETYDALSTRLIQFIHQHMPVRVLDDGRPTQIHVNRDDVVTLEPVRAAESPDRG